MPCKHNVNGVCQCYAAVSSRQEDHADFPYLTAGGHCLRNTPLVELRDRGIDPGYDECESYEYVPHDYCFIGSYRILCYDNEGWTADRYTVHILDLDSGEDTFLGMSAQPFHPQGICTHGDGTLGDHLGNPIEFSDLPTDCQKVVRGNLELDV